MTFWFCLVFFVSFFLDRTYGGYFPRPLLPLQSCEHKKGDSAKCSKCKSSVKIEVKAREPDPCVFPSVEEPTKDKAAKASVLILFKFSCLSFSCLLVFPVHFKKPKSRLRNKSPNTNRFSKRSHYWISSGLLLSSFFYSVFGYEEACDPFCCQTNTRWCLQMSRVRCQLLLPCSCFFFSRLWCSLSC